MASRLNELRAERDGLKKKATEALRGISEKRKAEGRKGPLTEEEKKQADDFDAQLVAIEGDIELEERIMAMERGSDAPAQAPAAGPVAVPGSGPVAQLEKAAGLRSPRTGFRGLGEFLQSVKTAAKGAQFMDRRLLGSMKPEALEDPRFFAGPSGADESVDSEGGFLVQTDWGGTLTAIMWDTGILTKKVKRQPIGAGFSGIKYNLLDETSRATGSRYGGIQVYWAAEADAFTGAKPKFRRLELRLQKLIGLMYVTDELLDDATALEGFVNEWFPQEFAFMLDDAIYQGTGAGIPLGVLKSPALVTIAKETGQASGTVVANNIEKMFAAMPASSLANASWYVNVMLWPQLFQLYHAIGTAGVPLFLPSGPEGSNLVDAPFGRLLGRPVIPIEQAAAPGTTGDIALVDFSRYIMADKGPIATAASIHVKFLTDEMAFRWVLRVDGQPTQHSPITPYKGSQVLSPYVALATR